jgi:benzoyl-CoA reductase/2-hydroxyglutaryl-CoA dehydratase subunit BcrC/BadD/HgdB
LGTFDYGDSFVPRDTDSVTQSIVGYLRHSTFQLLKKKSTVIIPVTSDNMRKLPAIVEKEANVITVDFPPDKNAAFAREKWVSQMHRIAGQLEMITKKHISQNDYRKAVTMVNSARIQMRRFETLTREKNAGVSGALSLFILNTYYYTDNISEWTLQLQRINEEIDKQSRVWVSSEWKPKVLIMGAPVYFPNFKIPFLVQNVGMDIWAAVNVMTQKILTSSVPAKDSADFFNYFDLSVWQFYLSDCSSAYIDNTVLLDNIRRMTAKHPVDGVIYHILKGQIEYDFELNRYDDYFNAQDVPVFRLETEYKYQDIEQLQIRVEAFKEMLVQNSYQKEKKII